MRHELFRAPIREQNDVVFVRQRARQIASLLGFDAMDQARIATAVSEIARNAVNYARDGNIEFAAETGDGAPPSLEIVIADRGPGIDDVQGVLAGRVRPAGAGLGLASARRLMDRVEIDSAPGKGTRVLLSKNLPGGAAALTRRDAERIAGELPRAAPENPFEEIQRQNRELMLAMDELRARQEQLERLNRELEDTNRGVLALYAELDEKAVQLRRSDELKTRFLSNMSHEFRTPLNSILALARLLQDRTDGDLTAEQAKQVAFIRKNAEDLSELVNDLLDIAKTDAGRTTVAPTEAEIGNLFGALRGIFRPMLTNSEVALVFEEPSGAPPLFTDEAKLSQVLRNLISNAIKFTERGTVKVSANYDAAARTVTFAVADTGIGIAPEDHERIFSEFEQVETHVQRRVKGTGLGLPLSKRLAELLGGRITLESAPGRGSTFYVTIPAEYGAPAAPGLETAVDPTRHQLLVIEGDREAAVLYEKYLKGAGFQVIAAATPEAARRYLMARRPVAILLDAAVGGGTGLDFLSQLKKDENTRGIPVYVSGTPEDDARARALGADDVFAKPAGRKRLLDRLRALARQTPGPTVLVVDDDDVARYIMRDLLADTRYRVIEAASGQDALALARSHRPSVIVLDLLMPGMSGEQVLDELARDASTADIPVIIVTSKPLGEGEREKLSRRAVAVLSKESSSRQEAIARIREALTRAEMSKRSPA